MTAEIQTVKVEFNTNRYYRSHGKEPRGRGGWGFCPPEFYDRGDYLDHVMWYYGTYAEAKKAAQAYFGPRGVQEVIVCP